MAVNASALAANPNTMVSNVTCEAHSPIFVINATMRPPVSVSAVCSEIAYHTCHPCDWPFRPQENCTISIGEHLAANGPSFTIQSYVHFGLSVVMIGVFCWRVILLVKSQRAKDGPLSSQFVFRVSLMVLVNEILKALSWNPIDPSGYFGIIPVGFSLITWDLM